MSKPTKSPSASRSASIRSTRAGKKPLIAVVCCEKQVGHYQVQSVNKFYIQAIRDFGGLPLLVPAGKEQGDIDQLLSLVDGVLLPGSHSNVAPHQYGASHHEPSLDEGRDSLSLPIIRQCADQNIPIFGICRGFQEVNVAMGGTLYQNVHQQQGFLDHREPESPDFQVKYAVAHPVRIAAGGLFRQWLPEQQEIPVNSLHGQGVQTLAPALVTEAVAPDGLVEAFSLPDHRFFVGVQWHPEWQATTLPFSRELFGRFMAAADPANS